MPSEIPTLDPTSTLDFGITVEIFDQELDAMNTYYRTSTTEGAPTRAYALPLLVTHPFDISGMFVPALPINTGRLQSIADGFKTSMDNNFSKVQITLNALTPLDQNHDLGEFDKTLVELERTTQSDFDKANHEKFFNLKAAAHDDPRLAPVTLSAAEKIGKTVANIADSIAACLKSILWPHQPVKQTGDSPRTAGD